MKYKLYFSITLIMVIVGIIYYSSIVSRGQPAEMNSFGGLVFSGNHKFPISPYRTKDNDKLKEKTKLSITRDKPLNLHGNYSIAFSATFRYNFSHGLIFKVENKSYSLKFIFDHHPDSSNIFLSLSFNNEGTPISFPIARQDIYDGKWYDFLFEIDEVQGLINGYVNGVRKEFRTKPFFGNQGSNVSFGAEGITKDCAPIILKDLRISINGKLEHRYLFTEMEGNIAYDSEGDLDAILSGHEWFINHHFKPVKNDSFYVNALATSISVHKTRNEIIINHEDMIKVYDISFHTFTDLRPTNGSNTQKTDDAVLSPAFYSDSISWNSSPLIKDDKENGLRYYIYKYPAGKSTLIRIFSIRTPVLNSSSYYSFFENSPTRVNERNQIIYEWSSIALGFLLILLIAYSGNKILKRKKVLLAREKEIFAKQTIIWEYPKTNYISIFGGLKLIDKNGINFADKLPPKLKELLAIVVFYSSHDRINSTHGVNFKKLEEVFWYSIKSENIKNNRNVTFSKIRNALKQFEDVSLKVKDDEVCLTHSESISNKVEEYFSLTDYLNISENSCDEIAYASFSGIVSEGIALAELHSEWAENTRSILRSKVIGLMEKYMTILFYKNDYESCIKIAEIAILHDPLHEATLKFKIKSHIILGENYAAEEYYNLFCERYYQMYKEEFPFEMDELLEE